MREELLHGHLALPKLLVSCLALKNVSRPEDCEEIC